MKQYTRAEIEKVLKSAKLRRFLKTKLTPLLAEEPLWTTPRIEAATPPKKPKTKRARATTKPLPGQFRVIETEDEDEEECEDAPGNHLHKQDAVIAGGALAALINEYLYAVPAVINDVDIFFYQFSGTTRESINKELYESMHCERFNYEINKTEEVGKINRIEIIPNEEFYWESLLESFDLTCCQVAWHLADNTLEFVPDFVEFLSTRVIQQSASFEDDYPITSFIRAQLKTQDLNCKFFISDALQNFLLHYHFDHYYKFNRPELKLVANKNQAKDDEEFVTQKRLAQWRARPQLLSPWLTLEGESIKIGEIYRQYHWHDFYTKVAHFTSANHSSLLRVLTHYFNERDAKYSHLTLFPRSQLNLLWQLLNHPILEEVWISNLLPEVNFLEHSVKAATLKSVAKFLGEHPRLRPIAFALLYSKRYNLPEVLTFFMELKRFNQPAVVGYMENLISAFLKHYLPPGITTQIEGRRPQDEDFRNYQRRREEEKSRVKIVEEWVGMVTAKQIVPGFTYLQGALAQELDKEKLCDPLPIKPFSKYVKELTQQSQLTNEGQFMGHCVGGYGSAVKNGESKIFHIETNGEHSTLELYIELARPKPQATLFRAIKKPSDKKTPKSARRLLNEYQVSQHCSKHNRRPSTKHQKIAQRLIAFLNYYRRANVTKA